MHKNTLDRGKNAEDEEGCHLEVGTDTKAISESVTAMPQTSACSNASAHATSPKTSKNEDREPHDEDVTGGL
eukprot:1500044-Amphidinium_carterae.1